MIVLLSNAAGIVKVWYKCTLGSIFYCLKLSMFSYDIL